MVELTNPCLPRINSSQANMNWSSTLGIISEPRVHDCQKFVSSIACQSDSALPTRMPRIMFHFSSRLGRIAPIGGVEMMALEWGVGLWEFYTVNAIKVHHALR